ncbi:rhodanese-like domain-containing protein [Bacteroidia bacterium]|nr:rhodanese-like domain-containing protein [Bacteroidia bacterium]MDB9882530.1 rhodanese-like domain-containing protein [Bacteroidia bacterium]MDC1395316.1 rhodanese-like domain-containing protein [Bacteroidia bacterium]
MLGFIKKLFGPGVDLAEKVREGAIILDVRSPGEYAGGHAKGSKNIPLDKISGKMNTIKKWNKPVIACCASGMRSGNAVGILNRNGIEAYNAGPWQNANRLIK